MYDREGIAGFVSSKLMHGKLNFVETKTSVNL